MKSQKGITLSTLIVYIVVLGIALGILTTVRQNFTENLQEGNNGLINELEYNKVGLFLLQESKQQMNGISDEHELQQPYEYIQFNNGNQYRYVPEDKAIYIINENHIIRIADYVERCDFSIIETENEKNILQANIKVEGLGEKLLQYTIVS